MMHIVFLTFSLAFAQIPDQSLSRQRDAIDSAIAAERRAEATARDQQGMLKAFRTIGGKSGVNYATSKCSSGWQRSDYEYQVSQMCDQQGCIPIFARPSETWYGTIFTCYINLGDGTECFAQSGFEKNEHVMGVFCTQPSLDKVNYRIVTRNGAVKKESVNPRPR